MNSFRLVLTIAALMAGHAAWAQASGPRSSEPGDSEKAKFSVEAEQASEGGNAVPAQPRYIRGNDQVVAPPKPVARIEGAPLSFNFEEAPVAEVVRTILGDVLKSPYVLHPPLSGTVTLSTRTPIPPDQVVFLLESALQANGLALMRDARGTYHVGRPDALKGLGGSIRQATGSAPLPPGYGAIVVPLQYIGAGEMATILRPMAQGDAIVRVDNVRNLLVLAGTRTQAEGWLDVIKTFDVDLLKGMSVGLFPLKYATIREVEAALRLVSGAPQAAAPSGGSTVAATAIPGAGNAAASAAASAMLGEGNPLFGALRIMPVERLNSILVVTPRAAYLEEARRWIEKLDQPSDNGAEAQLFIYRVQNGNAKHLAGVLSGIFGGTQGTSPTANNGVAPSLGSNTLGQQPFGNTGFGLGNNANTGYNRTGTAFGNSNTFGGNSAFGSQNRLSQQGQGMAGAAVTPGATVANVGNVRVMADELNNTILVWSNRAEFQKIEATLKRLDLPPTQVLIEAAIIEVTLNDDLNYGLQWAFNGSTGGGYQGAGQLGAGGVKAGTGSLADAAAKGFTYSLVNSAGQIRVALAALANKTMVKMISNPSIMVLDNHLAMMTVGNQVPVQTSTIDIVTSGSAVTSTVQYRDTGVNLAVTPSVNAGNLVTMQIDQTVTDTSTASDSSAQPIFLQRQISSKVAVRSGESIVLGGLIKDSQSAGKSGVPLLQDLPVVGNLFGTNKREGARTELLVVITPKVVRTDPEIREVSEELRDRLRGLEILNLRERPRAPQLPRVDEAQPNPR